MWAGEAVSGRLYVVLQGLGGGVFVDTLDTPKWERRGDELLQVPPGPQNQLQEAKFQVPFILNVSTLL